MLMAIWVSNQKKQQEIWNNDVTMQIKNKLNQKKKSSTRFLYEFIVSYVFEHNYEK